MSNDVVNYTGAILGNFEINGYHDSYFHAVVWDENQGCIRNFEIGATAYAGSKWRVEPDATDEMHAKARAWIVAEARALYRPRIVVDMVVRSLTTRGKGKDLTGRVERTAPSKFDPSGYRRNALVTADDGRSAWVDTERLEILEGMDWDAFEDGIAAEFDRDPAYTYYRCVRSPRVQRP